MRKAKGEIAPWHYMSVARLLTTLGVVAAGTAVLAFIANSAVSGLGYLWAILIAWLAFGAVMSLGLMAILIGAFVLHLVLIPVRSDAIEAGVYRFGRWAALVAGLGSIAWIGGWGVVDGLRDNRLVPQQVHYERCMTPRTRTVREIYESCRDGWHSESIGRQGACSHHGGVVRRWFERREAYQEHGPAYCQAEAESKSWLD